MKKYSFKYSEFIRYVKYLTPINRESSDDRDSSTKKFTETSSLKEALDLAENGWQAGIDQLSEELEKQINSGFDTELSVSGAFVNVGEFMSGNPECMVVYSEEVAPLKPELTICINLTYSGSVKGSKAVEYAKQCLKYINEMNIKYSIKVIGYFMSKQRNKTIDDIVEIQLKDFNENLALNTLAFALHPSFFRRLWFRHLESKEYWSSSYGYPYIEQQAIEYLELHCEEKGKKAYLPSLNASLKGLKRESVHYWS